MTATLIVPYQATEPHRAMAWAYVSDHLRSAHPDWQLLEGWRTSKAASVNQLALEAETDVLVLHDADSIVEPDSLHGAVQLVASGMSQWVVPHHKVYRLSRGATASWLQGDHTMRLTRNVYQGPAGGGVVVLSRAAFDEARGMDERFTEWGWEDQAFGRALGTLVGPYDRLASDLIHLWHPPALPSGKPGVAMTLLWQQYKRATFCPRLMRALVDGVDPEPWAPLEQPRHFHAATPRQVVRYGGKSAYFRDHKLSTSDPDLADAMRCYAEVSEVSAHAEP